MHTAHLLSHQMKGDRVQASSSQLAHLKQEVTEQRQEIARLREDRQQADEALLERVQSLLAAHLQQQHQLLDGHTKQQRIHPHRLVCLCVWVFPRHPLCNVAS